MGNEVGFEAVGRIDSTLTTVGIWTKATSEEEIAQRMDRDPSDIRVRSIGQTSLESEAVLDAVDGEASGETNVSLEASAHPSDNPSSTPLPLALDKGIVYYLDNQKIVGILLFNLFNRSSLARQILLEQRGVNELGKCTRLFNIHE